MLSNTLSSNEVKNASGTEVEFSRISISERATEFAQIAETPAYQHRLKISHQESGSGLNKRRRSLIRVDKTVLSSVDSETPVTVSAYVVLDTPIGALTANTEPSNVVAEIGSFVHTLATNTHLYDGTGNGAAALLAGGL